VRLGAAVGFSPALPARFGSDGIGALGAGSPAIAIDGINKVRAAPAVRRATL